jgi:hypothetical protein
MSSAVKILLYIPIILYFLIVLFADPPAPEAVEGILKFPGLGR